MAVEREEQAAKAGNPSPQRLRQDDSCLPIYSRLKSEINQPRPFPPRAGTWCQCGEHPTPPIHPSSQL